MSKADYEPTPEQSKAIRAAIKTSIMPLIEQVLVKKIGQATIFLMEEQAKREAIASGDHTALLQEAQRLLEYVTYHDNRYGQADNYEKFQKPACELVDRIKEALHEQG